MKPSKKKLKVAAPPPPPPPPEPPETRAEVTKTFVEYLASQVKLRQERVDAWKKRITNATNPTKLVSDLDWSASFFEDAAKLDVYTQVYEALTLEDSHATLDTVEEFITKKALDGARFVSRSSSPISNFNHECVTAAWASLADDIRVWAVLARKGDAFYAARPAGEKPKCECTGDYGNCPKCGMQGGPA